MLPCVVDVVLSKRAMSLEAQTLTLHLRSKDCFITESVTQPILDFKFRHSGEFGHIGGDQSEVVA